MPLRDEPFYLTRPTPFTDDMRAMVEDLKARGVYAPTPGERLAAEVVNAAFKVIASHLLNRMIADFLRDPTGFTQKGFHNGGLVSNSDVKPDLGLTGGCHGHLAKRDARNPTLPAGGNSFGGSRTGRVTVVVARDGGAE